VFAGVLTPEMVLVTPATVAELDQSMLTEERVFEPSKV
jgi:hypothetical protein